MSTRRMLFLPVEGPVEVVDAPHLVTLRQAIGAEYVERVRVAEDYSLIVDEDGHAKCLPINAKASLLYGTHLHGVPILGDVLLAREAFVDGEVDWVDTDPDVLFAFLVSRLPAISGVPAQRSGGAS